MSRIEHPFELPPGWVWCEFSQIAKVDSNLVNPAKYLDSTHIAPNHIEPRTGRLLNYTTISKDGVTSAKHLFAPGHILYSKIRPYLAKAALVNFSGLCSADMYPISTNLHPQFLLRWMLTPKFTELASGHQGRTVLPKINQADLARLPVPVPPMEEQRRIANKLDDLLAQVDACRDRLDRIPGILKRLRRSVLAAAFRGELTADWRAMQPNVEPASKILEQIKLERQVQSKGNSKNGSTRGYTGPESVASLGLPNLPEGWCWGSIEELTANFDGMRIPVKQSDRAKKQGPFPYYGASGIIDHVEDFLFNGSYLLIAEDGANLLSRNTPIAFQAHGQFWVNNHAHIVKTLGDIPLEFLEHYLNSIDLQFFITGSAQPKLTQATLNRIPVPLPPKSEILEIVEKVGKILQSLVPLEAAYEHWTLALGGLEQSILSQAFRGELLPQNPDDAPASVFLEQIHTERMEDSAAKPKRSRKSRPMAEV